MSALETTKKNPLSADQRYAVYSAHNASQTVCPLRSRFFLFVHLHGALYSSLRFCILPLWQTSSSLSSNNQTILPEDFHTENHCPGIGDNYIIQCPIIAPVCQEKHRYTAPKAPRKKVLIPTLQRMLLECLNIFKQAITFAVWGRAAGSSTVDLHRGGSLKLGVRDSLVLCWGLIKECSH